MSFDLGMLMMTTPAYHALPQGEVLLALARHARGDWGNVDADDWAANDRAIVEGTRLLSAYCARSGTKFWIITEADRSATTVLLPEDY